MKQFKVTKELACKLASASLEGCMLNAGILTGDTSEEIEILFEESNLEQCRKNNGPELLICPDYTFGCLAESILDLCQRGYKLKIGTWHRE